MIVGLQPTSPIRSSKSLDLAIKKFKKSGLDSLFSAQKFLIILYGKVR